jgi:hypothetical protein
MHSDRSTRTTELRTKLAKVKQLNREGIPVARYTVERLMKVLGLHGVRRGRKPRTTWPDPASPRPADLVEYEFNPTRPDALWVADFTYVSTWAANVSGPSRDTAGLCLALRSAQCPSMAPTRPPTSCATKSATEVCLPSKRNFPRASSTARPNAMIVADRTLKAGRLIHMRRKPTETKDKKCSTNMNHSIAAGGGNGVM